MDDATADACVEISLNERHLDRLWRGFDLRSKAVAVATVLDQTE